MGRLRLRRWQTTLLLPFLVAGMAAIAYAVSRTVDSHIIPSVLHGAPGAPGVRGSPGPPGSAAPLQTPLAPVVVVPTPRIIVVEPSSTDAHSTQLVAGAGGGSCTGGTLATAACGSGDGGASVDSVPSD